MRITNHKLIYISITFLLGVLTCTSSYALTVCDGTYSVSDAAGIAAISVCNEITGNLTIDSETLTNLSGLENLQTVGGNLYIRDNTSLVSLTGLNNLTTVAETVIIDSNPVLASLSALSSLAGTVFFLY